MAIVTSKFRVSAASGFASTFLTDNIYLILGRPQSWDNTLSTNFTTQANGTVTDNNPPNPVDNWLNEYAMWRDAMAGLKLNFSNVRLATRRLNWQSGIKYDMYRHDVSAFRLTESGRSDLSDANMIVYNTSNGAVYKCLFNGRDASNTTGVVSTVAPSTTNAAPQTTADGYIWKYLYTITAGDADFVTANYIPVITTTSVSNVNGIDVVVVEDGGTGYTGTPTVQIYGDGTGATVTATTSANKVSRVTVTNAGSGYTWAKVVFSGGGTPTTANATAIIAPTGGHGSNPVFETYGHNVMLAGTVTGYEQNDFPVNQDFRTVAIVRNPLTYNSSVGYYVTSNLGTVYSANAGRTMRTLTMTSSATTAPANDLVITGGSSGASGLFVFQSSGTTRLEYIQPVNSDVPANISDTRIDTAGNRQLKQFINSENITATGYSQNVTGNGITATLPEIHPYTGQLLYLDYRQPVTRSSGQNEKINIVINF